MDFTETPYAEDFAMELGEYAEKIADLIVAYRARGLPLQWIETIIEDTLCRDELFDDEDD